MTDGDPPKMADVNHTHPYTGETFGTVYRRGPAVADGGEGSSPGSGQVLRDIDHVPPNTDVEVVWNRGGRSSGESSQTGSTGISTETAAGNDSTVEDSSRGSDD